MGWEPPPDKRQGIIVFISYAKEDYNAARRIYNDLKIAGLNPWLDKESLLPGQNWEIEIKKVIKGSRYFISLNSSISVQKVGLVQKELKNALDVQDSFPESAIYLIPVRLDDCELAYQQLKKIQYVDLFPSWDNGFKRILQVIELEQKKQRDKVTIDRLKNSLEIPVVSIELGLISSKYTQFKGEKEFFVGRWEYINEKIKNAIRSPGSRVSIIGPGGSGKSQLAFKAIHQYEKEGIFDLIVPIYFDLNLMPLSQFLSNTAESMGIPISEFDKYDTESRKKIVRNVLSRKHHPLIYLDNYETVSYELSNKSKEPLQMAVEINNFLNDNIPNNTSILLTSRERYNKLREKEIIDLDGLSEKESKDLFNGLVVADHLLRNPKSERIKEKIGNLLKKTGGHPLSIELIGKNITSIEELEEISRSVGTKEVNRAAPEDRFRSLQACFGYTLSRLDNTLLELLPKLTIFKSPFPMAAAVDIFGVHKSSIIELYNRSLLTRIQSDYVYGTIEDPEYLL